MLLHGNCLSNYVVYITSNSTNFANMLFPFLKFLLVIPIDVFEVASVVEKDSGLQTASGLSQHQPSPSLRLLWKARHVYESVVL